MKIKHVLPFIVCLAYYSPVLSQQKYWQQEVNYKINVSLNDNQHSLKGVVSFEYINNSPDELSFIWIHLWPNAYKSKESALYKQIASQKEIKLKSFKEKGFIDSLLFTADGVNCKTEPHPKYIDIIKVILPSALPPGGKINISTPFFEQIPGYFSRMGHVDNYYMITQWYPKPAVYDSRGWHEMPYLDQGEFYSEFGSFDVSITVPSEYIVAATGDLETESELKEYKRAGAVNRKNIDEIIKGIKGEAEIARVLKNYQPARPSVNRSAANKTLRFRENNVHDFAWFASKEFVLQYDTLELLSGKTVDVFSFYKYFSSPQWYNSSNFIEDAVLHYSNWLGQYPYNSVKAVEGPGNESSGGMEYPTVTLITSPDADQEKLDAVITHEVGHNWLYGILASNERDHPWMDEGINTYFQFRYEAEKYRRNSLLGKNMPKEVTLKNTEEFQATFYNLINQNIPMEEPIETASQDFKTSDSYGLVVYIKTAVWLYVLEAVTSKEQVDNAFRSYFNKWQFKHPYPEDLKNAFSTSMNVNLDQFFGLLNKKGRVSN